MRTQRIVWLSVVLVLAVGVAAYALSLPIGRDLNFPKGFDPDRAQAIRRVIQDERFQFVDGIVSQWPPDWGTRLSYTGDAGSLNEFLTALRSLPGMSLRVILYRGRNDEQRRDSPWQLDFSQAQPDRLTVYLNLNAKELDFYRVRLPEWPAQ